VERNRNRLRIEKEGTILLERMVDYVVSGFQSGV